MEFESSQAAAIRLNVNVRTVQKWAKEGKIPRAKQVGRTWMIPTNIQGPTENALPSLNESEIKKKRDHITSLLNSSFVPGHCWEYIESIPDDDERTIVMGEYYYYSGQSEKAVELVEEYLEHEDMILALFACKVYILATLGLGGEGKKTHLTHRCMDYTKNYVGDILNSECDSETRAAAIFIMRNIAVLLHIPTTNIPPLEEELAYLPDGIKLFGTYILAHEAYLMKEYERSLGIAQTALLFIKETYPMAEMYLNLIVSVNLIILRRSKEAKKYFEQAWQLARQDKLIQSFAEHHGILHGMIELCMKKQWPDDFKKITGEAKYFNKGWVKIHNYETGRLVTDRLTTTEFSIAMLYNKGWSVKEISAHIEMSERSIKHHISVIYEKLGISSRNELTDFMQY